jgi:hypothetical protein
MGEGNFPFFNYLLMFKLVKTNYQNQNHYLLLNGTPIETGQNGFTLEVLGATFTPPNAQIPIINIDQIDSMILEDTDLQDWEVEVDSDLNIYLKSQQL